MLQRSLLKISLKVESSNFQRLVVGQLLLSLYNFCILLTLHFFCVKVIHKSFDLPAFHLHHISAINILFVLTCDNLDQEVQQVMDM
jgi:hypothetical protein